MGAYFLLIFNTHISFQSCNRRSTIDIRRSPRQHILKYLYIQRDKIVTKMTLTMVEKQ